MNTTIPKILTVAVGLTILSIGYNATRPAPRWPCNAPRNHDPGMDRDCGPGRRYLVVGASVALGQGASTTEAEWWLLACAALGGHWKNVAVPGYRASDEARSIAANPGYDVVIVLDGANDLIYGLAPEIPGQIERRLPEYFAAVLKMRSLVGWELPAEFLSEHEQREPHQRWGVMLHVLQPAPFGMPSANTTGYEDELRAIYAHMALLVDLDLSGADVDYRDLVHFGDRGQRIVANAIVEALR